jgi:hypothetical protein
MPDAVESNTFGLDDGDAIRRVLRGLFRSQRDRTLESLGVPGTRRAAVDFERKDIGPGFTWQVPDYGADTLDWVTAVTPRIESIWLESGRAEMTAIGLDPDSWSVTNPETAAAIRGQAMEFCEATNATTHLTVSDAYEGVRAKLVQGLIDQPAATTELVRLVREIFRDAETWRARRIATTEASRAVHAAQVLAAQRSGVVIGFRWLLSSDACPRCQRVAAEVNAVQIGRPFAITGDNATYGTAYHPPLHPHCCLPETPVVAPVGIAGIKAHYDGPVVRIHLIDGSDVTVTPNHMLLTPNGFATAASLMDGDDLVHYPVGERVASGDPDDHRDPPSIEKVFESWAESGRMVVRRVPVAPEYLHGDARFGKGDIDVVSSDGLLGGNRDPAAPEPAGESQFRGRDVRVPCLSRDCHLAAVLFALRDATDGGVGRLREAKAIIGAHAAVPDLLAVRDSANLHPGSDESAADGAPRQAVAPGKRQDGMTGPVQGDHLVGVDRLPRVVPDPFEFPDRNPGLHEAVAERAAGDADRIRECLERFPGSVATRQIVKVEMLHYSGPVYDLQTLTSLYLIGSGIVSSNCQCTILSVLSPAYSGEPAPDWGSPIDFRTANAPADALLALA